MEKGGLQKKEILINFLLMVTFWPQSLKFRFEKPNTDCLANCNYII